MNNPLLCERCGRALESDDAVSVIEGVCLSCRTTLRGLIQPLRADQLIAGLRLPDDDDDFLSSSKPRFRPKSSASPSTELNDALGGVTPADVRKTIAGANARAGIDNSAAATSHSGNSLEQTRTFVASAKRAAGTPHESKSQNTTQTPAPPSGVAPSRVMSNIHSQSREAAHSKVSELPTRSNQPIVTAERTESVDVKPAVAQAPVEGESTRAGANSQRANIHSQGVESGHAERRQHTERTPRVGAGISPALKDEIRSELRGLPAQGSSSTAPTTSPIASTPISAGGSASKDAAASQSDEKNTSRQAMRKTDGQKAQGIIGESKSASAESLGLTPKPVKRPKSKASESDSAEALAALSSAHGGKDTNRRASGDDENVRVVEALESRASVNINRFNPPAPPFDSDGSPRYRRRRRDLLIGTAFGLLLTFSVAYYAIKLQAPVDRLPIDKSAVATLPVALTISPSNAVVKLDGLELGPVDDQGRLTFSIPQGDAESHFIEVTAAGYHPLRQSVSAFMGAPEAYVSLLRQPFEVSITTNPPDAQVLINGELRGASPIQLMMEPTGESEVVIRRPGYAEFREKISAPEGAGPLALQYELIPAGQLVSITTDPPNATIRIDGELKGISPLKLELDSRYLGRRVEIAASLDGFDNSKVNVALPERGGGDTVTAALALKRTLARLNVYTDPPGGRVVIAGKDFGPSPAEIEFQPEETGKTVLVEASMNGTQFGRQEVTIPTAGEPTLVVVPMSFGAQRVVFLLASPATSGLDHFALTDQLMQQIHTLTPVQRFTIIAATDDGIETWPGGVEMETATSEQKIRAYDMIRSVRPTHQSSLASMLEASLAFQPTTVWLFVDGEIDRQALENFSTSIGSQQISVSIVRAMALNDETWFTAWTTAHRGTLSLLGRDAVPALAIDSSSEQN